MRLRPRLADPLPRAVFGALLAFASAGGCKTTAPKTPPDDQVVQVRHVDRIAGPSTTARLAGARCAGRNGSCACRSGSENQEIEPPAEGMKRFEIRMAADGGTAILESAPLGKFLTIGARDACFYVDVPAGAKADWLFTARADAPDVGFTPTLRIAEYGAAGPYWYDVLAVTCAGGYGKCDRKGADDWKESLKRRQRGRLDPCGSAVVTGLDWQTTGSMADRDGGFFRDFLVRFGMEVKSFATKFAPGSTECVPK